MPSRLTTASGTATSSSTDLARAVQPDDPERGVDAGIMAAMTRSEAIDWLRSVGLNASARDWALGETVLITVGQPDQVGAITVYPKGVVYVCPEADGRWVVIDCGWQDGRSRVAGFDLTRRHADLSSAVHAARDYVTRVEAALTLDTE